MKYGLRATVYCDFDISRYPIDDQTCNVSVGSHAFSAIFVLDKNDQYHHPDKYQAAGFDMSITFFDKNLDDGRNTVGLGIEMKRIMTPFIFKYYAPSMIIVLVSMISFVIPVTAIPGRVGLLVTLFLTLINLFINEMVSKV